MAATGPGYYICTDPDQEKSGYYRIGKTVNMGTTMTQLNASRATKDFRIVNFFPCTDIKKAEEFVRSALKAKYLPNSTEWVKLDTEAALAKVSGTVETLISIVNGAED